MTSRLARLLPLLLAATTLSGAPAHAERDAAAPAAGDLTVVVLGDSFSAGNGATDDAGAPLDVGPQGCERSAAAWGERYAAGLRAQGVAVTLTNRACSGGVTADIVRPREMDSERTLARTPEGVDTAAEAEAFLRSDDPCNTGEFPTEEFWTYRVNALTPVTIDYTCTRTLRAQAQAVDASTDLVLLTIGGNDAGFSTIVQGCFVAVTRSATACRTAVEAARALLPELGKRVRGDLDAVRARLRPDARVVQLSYPWLQVDNDFTLPSPTGGDPYPAGDEVRALVSEGNATIAAAAAQSSPQTLFLAGVPEAFSGHEPDAATVTGNPARWLNQAGEGALVDWYHPNRLGHVAYASLLLAGGTFGAPTTTVPVQARPTADLRVLRKKRAAPRSAVLRVRVRLSDDATPVGRIVVRQRGGKTVARDRLRVRDEGRTTVRVRGLRPGKRVLVVRYVDRGEAKAVTERVRVRVRR